VQQSVIDRACEQDASAAAAEWLAEFRTDIESFISRDALEVCVDVGTRERPPFAGIKYFAFADPSGGSADSFTLAVAHAEGEQVVVDCLREIVAPFDPESAVREFAAVLKSYGIHEVVTDRYASAWNSTAWQRHGIRHRPSEQSKSDLYLSLLPRINSRTVRLLDQPRSINQLSSLERRTARGGRDSIDHSPNARDDVANAIAGVASIAGRKRGEMRLGHLGPGGIITWRGGDEHQWLQPGDDPEASHHGGCYRDADGTIRLRPKPVERPKRVTSRVVGPW
jgi:hypothetical protein